MLDAIQEQLENIYGLRCEYRASDFVVDADSARKLGGSARAREELLVSEGEDGLELALYLHPSLTKPKSLGEFCEVVEGVSHFLYVVQAAREERHVSLLELEAQAEVDKFVVCALRSWGKGRELLHRLFDGISLHAHLSDDERWRYTEANRLARTYAQRLLPLIRAARLDRLLAEVRHAYRLGAEAKLHYFARRAF